jgi:lipid-binding SYLF domain-containing protein
MKPLTKLSRILSAVVFLFAISATQLLADSAAEIDAGVDATLKNLLASEPTVAELSKVAKGILVFPDVWKAGLIVGGKFGEGALREGGKTVGYYNTVAASYGLQAGVQKFGYVLFFMTDGALAHLKSSKGFEVGIGPSIVVVDKGVAKTFTTTTAKDEIYAFFMDQKGLMGGMGLEGTKMTKINPK